MNPNSSLTGWGSFESPNPLWVPGPEDGGPGPVALSSSQMASGIKGKWENGAEPQRTVRIQINWTEIWKAVDTIWAGTSVGYTAESQVREASRFLPESLDFILRP